MIDRFVYISSTKTFAKKSDEIKPREDPNAKRIGTLSVGIMTRKKIRDKKGRVRRKRVEFEAPLMSGQGAMNAVTAIQSFKKDLGNINSRKVKLNAKNYRKIVEAFKLSGK